MMSKIEDKYQDGGREKEDEMELPCQISHVFINSLICSGVYDE